MEKPVLRPDLRAILDQFAKFRNIYSTLKNHHEAYEELIQFQKLELEKVNSSVDQLGTALIDSRRRYKVNLHSLKVEIRQLQRDVANTREEFDGLLENRRIDDEQIRSLNDDLTALRSENAKCREEMELMKKRHEEENAKRQEEMELTKKGHEEEINLYKKKLESYDDQTQRHNDENKLYKQKLEEATKMAGKTILPRKNQARYVHPAFEDEPKKQKKSTPAASRWPQLDFAFEKEMVATQQSPRPQNKKKLYTNDNEMIVDLT